MKTYERISCAITGAEDLEELYTFKDFPIFMGCTEHPENLDVREDMIWYISRGSGLIQLKRLLPLDILYEEPHGSGSVGRLWREHHRMFAKFVNIARPKTVLEIGGGHGLLEREYQRYDNTDWVILEPNPSPVDGCKARFIKGFFGKDFCLPYTPDAVVHSHLLEHIYMPNDFMNDLSAYMKEGSSLIFSVPNMDAMMERKYTNCINFEHTLLLTEPYIDYLLSANGYRIVSKEYFKDDHSIFISATKSSNVSVKDMPADLYEKNKKVFENYIEYHKKLVQSLNIKLLNSDRNVYLFSAHVFSQYLINMGLNTTKIICLLDNDQFKQGKRLYGTTLTVESPNVLKGVYQPVVILKTGVYNKEIKEDIWTNINPSTIFLE